MHGEAALPSDEPGETPAPRAGPAGDVQSDSFAAAETLVSRGSPGILAEVAGGHIGCYRLIEELGEGGFGVVWRAEQHEPIHREVALKVIKPGMDSREIIARFEAERQTLALMDHPHIAVVLDAGTTRLGRPYFVMELVKGVPITVYCDEHKLTIRQRLELFIPVCKAVQHAHQKAVLHRDLKPSNILVSEVDGTPFPKVIDFGIAKALGVTRDKDPLVSMAWTQEGMIVGTPRYMSPEQAGLGTDIDTRSDIYSLGAILYELFTGDTPLSGEAWRAAALDQVMRLIRESDPVRPSSRVVPATDVTRRTSSARGTEPLRLSRALRGDLDWITLKALEKERARRYESAAALAQDLERHLNNEPVEAGAPSALYRMRKLVRRNRLAVGASAAILTSLVAGIAVTTWQAVRATRAETLATERLHQVTAERRRTLQALSRADHRQAVKLIAEERLPEALAHLARAIRTDPQDIAAGSALTSLLAQRNWSLPLGEPRRFDTTIRHASLSRDGRRIAISDSAALLTIWDVGSGRAVGGRMEHPSNVFTSAFSHDGRHLAAACSLDEASGDWGARVWEVESGQPVTGFMRHAHEIDSLGFSPDGLRLVTGSGDAAQVWNVAGGAPLGDPVRLEARIHFVTFSPDGERLLLAAWDTARIWDIRRRKLVGEPMHHSVPIEFAAFSPDGSLVATASYDKTARVWNAATGAAVTEPILHDGAVLRVAFSPDGQRIATACEDNATRIFDARSGRLLSSPMMLGQYVRDLAFSSDGRRMVTASGDYDRPLVAHIWDAQEGAMFADSMKHSDAVLFAAFSPDGTRAVTASKDGTARIWNAKDGRPITGPLQHDGPVNHACFSGDGRRLATASEDGTARIWDVPGGAPVGGPLRHEGAVKHVAFASDGRRLITASKDLTARIWGVSTGRQLTEPIRHEGIVNSASFSPDGRNVVTASEDNSARVWDAANGMPITPPLKHDLSGESNGEGVQSAEFSPDGKLILTGSKDHTARLWDARTGKSVAKPFQHQAMVNRAVFSSDGKLVATAAGEYGKPGWARVWSVEKGFPMTGPLQHQEGVVAVSFSTDGRRLVTASYDKSARVWDVPSGQPVGEPLLHEGFVTAASYDPLNQRVLASTWDGEARIWEFPEDAAPVPPWLADLGEAVGGRSLNEADVFENVPLDKLLRLRERINHAVVDDAHVRFARWFFARRSSRAISPGSSISVPDYVARRIQEATRVSLENACRADPGNQQAWKLLRALKDGSP